MLRRLTNCFILCQPSDDVGLSHADSSSERAFNLLPVINSLSGFSNFRWQEPTAETHFLLYILSSGTDHCTFPDSITSPQLSFRIKYHFQTFSKQKNFVCCFLKSNVLQNTGPAGDVPLSQRNMQTDQQVLLGAPQDSANTNQFCGSSQGSGLSAHSQLKLSAKAR